MKNVFKKISAVAALLVLAAGLLFAAGSRKQIDTFLKDYENFVVKTEKAADKGDLSSLMSLQTESLKLLEKADNLKDTSDWNGKDSEKYLKLTNRYNEAVMKLTNSLGGY